ncbi:MAG TPA: hypothetical protein VKK81_06615 [Candidatus Binatia bacterium]|nr:hypothetical protein [Candidatus Binatia bacterium]
MTALSALIERTRRRVVRQRQINVLSFFLPLAIATGVVCRVMLAAFSLPMLLALIAPILCSGLLFVSLSRMQKVTTKETIAALLDEKTAGQDRFLTLATCSETQSNTPFLALVNQQAAKQAASFEPRRDFPFKLDRRVPATLLAAALSVLLLLLIPPTSLLSPPVSDSSPEAVLTDLEEIAHILMSKGSTPQAQATGAQLLTLIQKLKDPTLSPPEKRRLIDEAQQRIKLNLPLPQLLPFDLKLFATESKKDNGQGNQGDQPQSDNQPLAKANQNLEQLKKTLSAAAGNEPQPGPQKDGEQQPQPREAGGSIKFNLPQPQSGKQQQRTGQESPGQQQKSAQDQAPNNQISGTDPNRPGGQKDQGKNQEHQGSTPEPQQNELQEKGTGSTVGGSPGERFLQPGEQPGGFLTKDARFVKVRIPVGDEIQAESDRRTENRASAQPKVPYSNAPLKEGPPDQAQPKQPIPLEYRKILQ